MGGACSQQQQVNAPKAAAQNHLRDTKVTPTPTPAAPPVDNSIDRTLDNMARQEAKKNEPNGGIGKGGPNAPAGSDGAPITSDEQERIETILNSPLCAAITPPIVKIIRETWALSMKRSDFAVAFYNDLLTKHRSATEAIFFGVDIVLQAGRLVKMIEGAINLLENPKSLVPVIIRLGSRHVAYGTTSQHFQLVTDSLVDLIQETVGPAKITPEVVGYWRTVLGYFQLIMESGYTTVAGKGVGKKHHSRIQRTLLKCWKSAIIGHGKQLKQAGGAAVLPQVSVAIATANAHIKSPHITSPTGSSPTLNKDANKPTLIFGVPSSITEYMLGVAMQQYIANAGAPVTAAPVNPTPTAVTIHRSVTENEVVNFESSLDINAAPLNHLIVPPISTTALEAFAKLPSHEFDQLLSDVFELGISHIDDAMPFFAGHAHPHGVEPPLTLAQAEMLYNRLQSTGRLLGHSLGARKGDPESFNDAFVKATLQFAAPEWSNPFVRDQLARFWMKFCNYMSVGNTNINISTEEQGGQVK